MYDTMYQDIIEMNDRDLVDAILQLIMYSKCEEFRGSLLGLQKTREGRDRIDESGFEEENNKEYHEKQQEAVIYHTTILPLLLQLHQNGELTTPEAQRMTC